MRSKSSARLLDGDVELGESPPSLPRAATPRASSSARGTLSSSCREQLTFVDRHALFDQHDDDLAGDLRTDGCLAARDDVAGRVEHARARRRCLRAALCAIAVRYRQRLGARKFDDECDERDTADDRAEQQPADRAAAARLGGLAVDLQLIEQGFLVHAERRSFAPGARRGSVHCESARV